MTLKVADNHYDRLS